MAKVQTEYTFALALLHYWVCSLLHIGFSPKEICWSSRKSVILHRHLNKNIKITMLQRRMNNWTTVSDRGIKCLEVLLRVHTSGIEAFYTFRDISRRTFDKPSGIPMMLVSCWNDKWKPSESSCQTFRRFLLCACWWRSHNALFSVNSVHGL